MKNKSLCHKENVKKDADITAEAMKSIPPNIQMDLCNQILSILIGHPVRCLILHSSEAYTLCSEFCTYSNEVGLGS